MITGIRPRLRNLSEYAALISLVFAASTSFAGAIGETDEISLSAEEQQEFRDRGLVVAVAGEERFLIGDQLFRLEGVAPRAFDGRRWPGGTFVYEFSPEIAGNAIWVSRFLAACAMWESAVPNIRCRARTSEANYTYVQTHRTPACVSYSSDTGMVGGRQVISIYHDPANFTCLSGWDSSQISVVAHEIGHAIGLAHEMKRWDRRSYINFIPRNLTDPTDPALLYQYSIIPGTINTTYTPYDFNSIMHYRDTDNARPGSVVMEFSTCFAGFAPSIGTTGAVTQSDALEMQHHYGQPIYDMLRRQRDPLCGTVRLNAAERKHYCEDLAENCGTGAGTRLNAAVTTGHSTSWCPGAFAPVCTQPGPHRSCCGVAGKTPFDVQHRRGSRDCFPLRRKHHSNWSCGCAYYLVNERCFSATFGFNRDKVNEYLGSREVGLRKLGLFARMLIELGDQNLLADDALYRLEDEMIKDFGIEHYYLALDRSRRELAIMKHIGRISVDAPLGRTTLHTIIAKNLANSGPCPKNRSK